MTEEGMHNAGKITNQLTFTDDELAAAIRGTKLALAFLVGKGIEFTIAINPLRRELYQFETWMERRKHP